MREIWYVLILPAYITKCIIVDLTVLYSFHSLIIQCRWILKEIFMYYYPIEHFFLPYFDFSLNRSIRRQMDRFSANQNALFSSVGLFKYMDIQTVLERFLSIENVLSIWKMFKATEYIEKNLNHLKGFSHENLIFQFGKYSIFLSQNNTFTDFDSLSQPKHFPFWKLHFAVKHKNIFKDFATKTFVTSEIIRRIWGYSFVLLG